jgi:hypothetical protein
MDYSRSHLVAWAAGIMDGEGAVQICRAYRNPARYYCDQIYMCIGAQCTSFETLQRLADLFGGKVKPVNSTPHRVRNQRQMWYWKIFSARAVAALEEMQPFFVSKAKHAKLAIEFFQRCIKTESDNVRLSKDEIAMRMDYYERMSVLQIKGIGSKKAQKKTGNYSKVLPITLVA